MPEANNECISTSFWVLCAPKSWLKYTTILISYFSSYAIYLFLLFSKIKWILWLHSSYSEVLSHIFELFTLIVFIVFNLWEISNAFSFVEISLLNALKKLVRVKKFFFLGQHRCHLTLNGHP